MGEPFHKKDAHRADALQKQRRLLVQQIPQSQYRLQLFLANRQFSGFHAVAQFPKVNLEPFAASGD
jgi:hypothetical protein